MFKITRLRLTGIQLGPLCSLTTNLNLSSYQLKFLRILGEILSDGCLQPFYKNTTLLQNALVFKSWRPIEKILAQEKWGGRNQKKQATTAFISNYAISAPYDFLSFKIMDFTRKAENNQCVFSKLLFQKHFSYVGIENKTATKKGLCALPRQEKFCLKYIFCSPQKYFGVFLSPVWCSRFLCYGRISLLFLFFLDQLVTEFVMYCRWLSFCSLASTTKYHHLMYIFSYLLLFWLKTKAGLSFLVFLSGNSWWYGSVV